MTTAIRPTKVDMVWLGVVYPNLDYDDEVQKVWGELDLRASYDVMDRALRIEGSERDERVRSASNYIQDVFEIEMRLGAEFVGPESWPSVVETGGRTASIAEKWKIAPSDLHLNPDQSFCLGLTYPQPRLLPLREIIKSLVAPFLYRLGFVDLYGLEAARRELWGEYSHGPAGRVERRQELAGYARRAVGRNDRCPCGSGKKVKKCCLDEIQEWNRRAPRLRSCPNSF